MKAMPVDRIVKTYPISEHELSTIGTLNRQSSFCFGVATWAIGFAMALAVNILQEANPATKNLSLTLSVIAILIVIAISFMVAGGTAVYSRHAEWNKIKSEAINEIVASGSQKTPA
jgi:hypothetical protein